MDVVVVGSCNTDLISFVPRLPKAGETLHGHKFSMGFGGKGANQCVVSARLGASAAMVAKVGTDTFGENFIKNFRDNNINVDHISQTSEASTGVAPICVNEQGHNSIVIVSGANLLLNEDDVTKARPIIEKAKVMVCQLETKPATSLAALKLAKQLGLITIFNPAPAQKTLDPEIYQNTDIFCPNESEAEILTGLPVTTVEEAKKALAELIVRGCACVIITLGEKGAIAASKEEPEPVHVPATPVKPVDTTGAGDAFVGALAFYMARYPSLQLAEKIRRAGRVASVSVLAEGTQTSFPRRKDLPEELFSS